MVFEDLVKPWDAKRHPARLLFFGLLFAFFSIAFSLWIFPEYTGLVMVFLVVLMTTPLMYLTLISEEQEEFRTDNELWLLKEHGKVITFLMYLFFGLVIGFSLFYI